jgi:hypothetical protein
MTVQTFRNLLSQRPFRPFRLVMSSGQAYDVRHLDLAMLTGAGLLVGVGQTYEGVPDDFRICPFPGISAVEPLPAPSADSRPTGPA